MISAVLISNAFRFANLIVPRYRKFVNNHSAHSQNFLFKNIPKIVGYLLISFTFLALPLLIILFIIYYNLIHFILLINIYPAKKLLADKFWNMFGKE